MSKKINFNEDTERILAKVITKHNKNTSEEFYNCIHNQIKVARIGNEGYGVNIKIFDPYKKPWKQKSFFTKVFYNEINYAKRKYNITSTEIDFLISLCGNLMWGYNLLVDKNLNPLDYTTLSKLLDLNKRTTQRRLKTLEDKKCVYSIIDNKKKYYIINPYLMFCGKIINTQVVDAFKLSGYISKEVDRLVSKEKYRVIEEEKQKKSKKHSNSEFDANKIMDKKVQLQN